MGNAYSYDFKQNLQVTGDPAYSGYGLKWAVASGSLPAGLSLNADTGVLSGTPTTQGTASFTLAATYKTKSGTQSYQIPVELAVSLSLTESVPTQTTVGQPYSFNLSPLLTVAGDSAYNGSGVTWTTVSNALPAGLSFNASTGVVSGTASAEGSGSLHLQRDAG